MTARKEKACKQCSAPFIPSQPMQRVCGVRCAIDHASATREKVERKAIREAKQQAKTRGQWQAEAQQAFNAWVRARDADLPCISCGRHHAGQNHAGHFFSVGARPNLRFHEANVHKQCATCNTYLHGNLINYRIGLIARIGLEAVEALEADQEPRKYSIDDLKAIKATYAAKRREIEKERAA